MRKQFNCTPLQCVLSSHAVKGLHLDRKRDWPSKIEEVLLDDTGSATDFHHKCNREETKGNRKGSPWKRSEKSNVAKIHHRLFSTSQQRDGTKQFLFESKLFAEKNVLTK